MKARRTYRDFGTLSVLDEVLYFFARLSSSSLDSLLRGGLPRKPGISTLGGLFSSRGPAAPQCQKLVTCCYARGALAAKKVAVATFSDEVKVRRRAILEYILVLLPKDPLIPPTWRPRFAAVRRNNSPLDALWCCVDQGNTGTLQQ